MGLQWRTLALVYMGHTQVSPLMRAARVSHSTPWKMSLSRTPFISCARGSAPTDSFTNIHEIHSGVLYQAGLAHTPPDPAVDGRLAELA